MSSDIQKGAFLAYHADSPQPRVIVFPLNPESIRRRIVAPPAAGVFQRRREALERISLVLAVDARLDEDGGVADEDGCAPGVLPFLSAVELLAQPAGAARRGGSTRAAGMVGIGRFFAGLFGADRRAPLPRVGLLLGSQRLIPVTIRSIHVTEQEFDRTLTPVRATVRIVMDALTGQDGERDPAIREMHEHYLRLKLQLANDNLARPDRGGAGLRGAAVLLR